jgi:hypothetical protein
MTDTDLQSKLAEYQDIVRQLTDRLRETVDENDNTINYGFWWRT